MNDEDRYRFLHDLWEFNNEDYTMPFLRRVSKSKVTVGIPTPNNIVGSRDSNKSRKKIIDIVCFCLMPNHFHLLIKQIKQDGISLFMQKIGTGYVNYFNEKYERSGALFQGRFKAKHIDNDAYLAHLSKYIHLNPVDLAEPDWQENGLKDPAAAREFLKNYKWSSFKDYIGEKNYPSLIDKSLLMDMTGGEKGYKKFAFDLFGKDFCARGASASGGENIKDYIIE